MVIFEKLTVAKLRSAKWGYFNFSVGQSITAGCRLKVFRAGNSRAVKETEPSSGYTVTSAFWTLISASPCRVPTNISSVGGLSFSAHRVC